MKGVWAAGALVLAGCAQVSSPTGGPVDVEPPRVVAGSPTYGAVNVRPEALVLEFDEYIVARNAASQLLISPPIAPSPVPVVRGKRVQLELPAAALLPGTTYVVAFGDGIVDLHEGLPASGVQWAFSTGPVLDTLAVHGRVVDRLTGAGVAGVRAMAHRADVPIDSVRAGRKPDRTAVTDAEGNFALQHLAPGAYRVWAVADTDRDYCWTEGEAVAVLEPLAEAGDTVHHRLALDTPLPLPALLSATGDSTGFVRFVVKGGAGVQLEPVPGVDGVQRAVWGADSAWAWMPGPGPYPTRWCIPGIDTVDVRTARRAEPVELIARGWRWDSLPAVRPLQGDHPAMAFREVQWNRPIASFDPGAWKVTRDSTPVEARVELGIRPGTVRLQLDEKPGTYRIEALPGAVVGWGATQRADTSFWQWTVRGPESWAELQITPAATFPAGWLEVLNSTGAVLAAQPIGPEFQRVVLSGLPPGPVRLLLRHDVDGNGEWDGVDVTRWRAPEPALHGGEAVELRANWVMEVVWPKIDVP